MTNTLSSLNNAFGTYNEQSAEFLELCHATPNASRDIQHLHRRILLHSEKQEAEFAAARRTIQEDLKTRVTDSLRTHIRDSIKTEVATQVRQEMDLQILDHIPIPLAQQVVDNKKQIADIKTLLANSEARIENASIQAINQDEPLASVLRADGTRSEMFPADLRTLFSYDCEGTLERL